MNKKIGSIFAYSVLSLLTLIGCNNNQSTSSSSSNSSSVSDSSTSSEISNSSSSSEESKYDYKLEDGEVEVVEYKKNLLTKPDFSLVEIEGIDKVAFDPFEYYYAFGEASYFYPNEDTIKDNVVLYSSNFYKQNTIKRNEDCKEYILNRIDSKIFEVKEIKEGSDNFIPFNGAVLSIPNCKGISYKVNDQITLNKGEIPLYKLGLYNQDGYRIAIRHANTQSWNNTGITLIDNNTLDFASYSSFKKAVCMNLVLSNDGKSYRVDKFRVNKNTGRVYSNVNDGICLLSDLEGYGFENLALFKGIRFNLNDKVFFENNDTLYNQSKTFKLNNTNYFSYNIDTDITIGVNIKKITKSTDSRWNFEAAVDENGTITEIGINVDIPKNGYKLLFSGTDSSSYSERVSVFVSENFKVGAHVELSDGKVIVDYNNESYVSNLYDVANNMYKKINTELVTYNYSYDYKTITSVGKSLKEINTQIDELIYNEDSLSRYKIYAIIGKLKQIIQDLEASTSINRAAQVKTTWYITDFTNNDKDLSHLIKNLERIRKSGINEIIVNAMDNGKVYYSNSKIYTKSLTDISFGEYGHDYIKAIISEAHKLNMKVFINFTPFTDGIENNFTELKEKRALSINGYDKVSTSQGDVSMLDPASDLVQQRIKDSIEDFISCNPNADGISLDYIRYGADNNAINTVMGISEDALAKFNVYCSNNGFSTIASLDSLKNRLRNNSSYFSLFNEFQKTLITDTVRNVKSVCLKYDKPLTCAVADNYINTQTWKCQDYSAWAKENIVDGLYLMDYYFDKYYVDYYFDDIYHYTKEGIDSNCILVGAIDPSYARLPANFYPRVINGVLNKSNITSGYGIFGTHTQNAKKDGWELIADSNYYDSVSPYDSINTIINKTIEYINDNCDNIYIKHGNQTNDQKELLINDLNKLLDINDYSKLITELNLMKSNSYADSYAFDRINEEIDYLISMIKLHINIEG